jgi:hypothetical protein
MQPLHLAVKSGRLRTVKLILEFRKLDLLLTNVNGHTPLHIAVRQGYAELVRLLIDASPAAVLHTEDGVGQVPLEVAAQQELLWRTRDKFNQDLPNFGELGCNTVPLIPTRFQPTTEIEIENLKITLEALLLDGRLQQNTLLTNALFTFAQSLKAKFNASKPAPAGPGPKENKDPKDEVDRRLTLQHVQGAASKAPDIRRLLHLLDVQKSVQSDLPKPNESLSAKLHRNKDDDGLELEEDEEQERRRRSLVLSVVSVRSTVKPERGEFPQLNTSQFRYHNVPFQ